jgi:tetratricopeptide (TPR) repeat protein
MKSRPFATTVLAAFLASGAGAQDSPLSPAEKRISAARAAIEKTPESHSAYNALALALSRRARETSDPRYYEEAEEALAASFQLFPDNFEGARIRAWVLLGKHEFERALEEARALQLRSKDDLLTYAILVDAHIELGNYDEAEEQAQWVLDLSPGNPAGLTRGAYLREIFGDIEGAIEWMRQVYEQTHFNEFEDRAWLLTQIAHLELSRGDVEAAERSLDGALALFPGYHYSLRELAKVRAAQNRHIEAVELLRERYRKAPHPENLYDLAEALLRAGRTEEAEAAFARFESEALREADKADNSNRELIFYYIDRAGKAEKALALAEKEIEKRKDVFTREAYAWALYRNGRAERARQEIEKALRTGIRDARMLYRAGVICSGLDREVSAGYLRQSLAANPVSEVARLAREELRSLGGEALGEGGASR